MNSVSFRHLSLILRNVSSSTLHVISLSLFFFFFPWEHLCCCEFSPSREVNLYFQVSLPSPYKHCIDSFSILPTTRRYIFFLYISLKNYVFSHHKNIAYSLKKVLTKTQKAKKSKKIQLCIIL